jgi:NADPH:quinone reductase-like Zn-dependent oxidoreductase
MRAMVFESYGEPEVMRLRDALVPEPQDSEVLIRVGYAGVQPIRFESTFGPERTGGL